jgi:MFS family permease
MICWGTIATAHSQVRSYTELMVLRFFLGIWESGFFPGVVYFLTLFYRKSEIATRIALFYSTSVLSHSFAGILAYYILRLRGSGGMAGWQWLFVIEGIPTIVIAVFAL